MNSSVEGPDSKTVEAFEHDGRLLTGGTDPVEKERKPLQPGICATPLAVVKPVFDTIVHPSVPTVPPMRAMLPVGACTVTEHPALAPDKDMVCCPPGHSSIVEDRPVPG